MADYRKRAHQAYYRIEGSDNLSDVSVPLIVNSCGEAYYNNDYINPRTRKDYYLLYMINGSITIEWQDKKEALKRGSVLFVSPDTFFSQITKIKSGEYIDYLWAHFTGNEVENLFHELKLQSNSIHFIDVKNEIISLFEELFSEFRNSVSTRDKTASIILRYILLKISRAKKENKKEIKRLDTSLKYIHTHLSEPLNLEKLSSMEYLSVSRYRDLFRKITGYSPNEYISRTRIRHACELICEGVLSIDEIAKKVGYPDRLYFQRVFKSRLGITPGEYKKQVT